MNFKYTKQLKQVLPQCVIDEVRSISGLPISNAPARVGRQVLDIIESNQPIDFPITVSYEDESIELTEDLYNTLSQQLDDNYAHYKITKSKYRRQELVDPLKSKIIGLLPECLRDLNPTPILQSVVLPGNGLIPHSDFIRKASLFCLLDSEGDWVTSWYSGPDPVVESRKFDFWWPYTDPDKLTEEKSIQFEKNKWYLFDNEAYHSVHGFNKLAARVALGIEFRSGISAEELHEILAAENLI